MMIQTRFLLARVCFLFTFICALNVAHAELTKQGSGSYRWWGIKVYDATLLTPDHFDGDYSRTRPLALEITYNINIKKEALIESTYDQWSEIATGQQPGCGNKKRWSAVLLTIWPNLAKGDSLKVVVTSENVAQFYHNDAFVGNVPDPAFAHCFLSIWLAQDTTAPDLRKQLLSIPTQSGILF